MTRALTEDAARAVQRLARALVVREATDDTLIAVAKTADALADEVEAAGPRDRIARYVERWTSRQLEGAHNPVRIADGATVRIFPLSPVGGREHPANLGLTIHRDGDAAVGTISFDVPAEAAPGRAHGGLIAACVDEMFAAALMIVQTIAYTGELTVRYRRACPIGVPVEFRAWVEERNGRKLDLRCVGTAEGTEVVHARGVGIAVGGDGPGS